MEVIVNSVLSTNLNNNVIYISPISFTTYLQNVREQGIRKAEQ